MEHVLAPRPLAVESPHGRKGADQKRQHRQHDDIEPAGPRHPLAHLVRECRPDHPQHLAGTLHAAHLGLRHQKVAVRHLVDEQAVARGADRQENGHRQVELSPRLHGRHHHQQQEERQQRQEYLAFHEADPHPDPDHADAIGQRPGPMDRRDEEGQHQQRQEHVEDIVAEMSRRLPRRGREDEHERRDQSSKHRGAARELDRILVMDRLIDEEAHKPAQEPCREHAAGNREKVQPQPHARRERSAAHGLDDHPPYRMQRLLQRIHPHPLRRQARGGFGKQIACHRERIEAQRDK